MMATDPKLEHYIKHCFKKGKKEDLVTDKLTKVGWSKNSIKEVMQSLELKNAQCPKCGTIIHVDDTFCPGCGEYIGVVGEGPIRVTVNAMRFVKPQVCACCMGRAETDFEVNFTRWVGIRVPRIDRSQSERFPLCKKCSAHIQKYSNYNKLILTIIRKMRDQISSKNKPIVTGSIFFFIIFIFALAASNWFWFLLFPNLFINYVWYKKILLDSQKFQINSGKELSEIKKDISLFMKDSCACKSEPVKYEDLKNWKHTFIFENPKYASLFKKENKEKIVY